MLYETSPETSSSRARRRFEYTKSLDSRVSNTQFPVFKKELARDGVGTMASDERVRQLFAQLLRAENPAVIETVAAQLKIAVDEYVRRTKPNTPAVVTLPFEQGVS